MKIIKTKISGLLIIEPRIFKDRRGYFFESYNQNSLSENNIDFESMQDNESYSGRNVIRGLHYQLNPMAQAKLIRVIRGKIRDVAVDIRKGSPDFGKWISVDLDSESKRQLFIPRGFAHGYSVLSDDAIILYKCDNFYSPEHERGIALDDPQLNIDWGIKSQEALISEKDKKNPQFSSVETNFIFQK